MSEVELKFCESYEKKLRFLQILNSASDALTAYGKKNHTELKKWIDLNRDKYLTITGK